MSEKLNPILDINQDNKLDKKDIVEMQKIMKSVKETQEGMNQYIGALNEQITKLNINNIKDLQFSCLQVLNGGEELSQEEKNNILSGNDSVKKSLLSILFMIDGKISSIINKSIKKFNKNKHDEKQDLKKIMETKEKFNISELAEYFNINENKAENLSDKLNEIGLDATIFLNKYKNFIDTKLSGLNEEYLNKIKLSIGRKFLKLDISKLVSENVGGLEKGETIKNSRWIINDILKSSFNFIDNEVFPTAQILIKEKNKKLRISKREESLYNVSEKLIEAKKMFEAEVLENGDFDKTWKSGEIIDANTNTWNIFDTGATTATLTNGGIDSQYLKASERQELFEGADLLSEADKKIEKESMKKMMALIMAMVGGSFAGPVGALGDMGYNAVDFCKNEDLAITILKQLPEPYGIPQEYHMQKTFFDNLGAFIGMIPLTGGAIKLGKIGKLAAKYGINMSEVRALASKLGDKKNVEFQETVNEVVSGKKAKFGKVGSEKEKIVENSEKLDGVLKLRITDKLSYNFSEKYVSVKDTTKIKTEEDKLYYLRFDHGTTSESLIGITKEGGLIPSSKNKNIRTGEYTWNKHISKKGGLDAVSISDRRVDPESAIAYSNRNVKINHEIDNKKSIYVKDLSGLEDFEKELIMNPFPMIYGIEHSKELRNKGVSVGRIIAKPKGEVEIKSKISLGKNIKVVFVPNDKIFDVDNYFYEKGIDIKVMSIEKYKEHAKNINIKKETSSDYGKVLDIELLDKSNFTRFIIGNKSKILKKLRDFGDKYIFKEKYLEKNVKLGITFSNCEISKMKVGEKLIDNNGSPYIVSKLENNGDVFLKNRSSGKEYVIFKIKGQNIIVDLQDGKQVEKISTFRKINSKNLNGDVLSTDRPLDPFNGDDVRVIKNYNVSDHIKYIKAEKKINSILDKIRINGINSPEDINNLLKFSDLKKDGEGLSFMYNRNRMGSYSDFNEKTISQKFLSMNHIKGLEANSISPNFVNGGDCNNYSITMSELFIKNNIEHTIVSMGKNGHSFITYKIGDKHFYLDPTAHINKEIKIGENWAYSNTEGKIISLKPFIIKELDGSTDNLVNYTGNNNGLNNFITNRDSNLIDYLPIYSNSIGNINIESLVDGIQIGDLKLTGKEYKYAKTVFFNNNLSVQEILKQAGIENYKTFSRHINEEDFKNLFLFGYTYKDKSNIGEYTKDSLIENGIIYSDYEFEELAKKN